MKEGIKELSWLSSRYWGKSWLFICNFGRKVGDEDKGGKELLA